MKKVLGGSGSIGNLHTVVAILVRYFLNNLGQILFKIFAPKSECFTRYDAFCWYIFDYACLRHKAYCYRKGSKLWKNCNFQQHV